MKYLKYLSYVIRHRWFVMLACWKAGYIWLGIIHDWSKFRPSEFFPYAEHFYGKGKDIKSGRDETGYYKPTDTGDRAFDFAWLLHQKRNRHHWQWWIIPDEDGETMFFIPRKYAIEMLSDWRGAGRAQGTPDVMAWYEKNKDKMRLDPVSRQHIEGDLLYR